MAFVNDYLTEEEIEKFRGYNLKYPEWTDHGNRTIGVYENSIKGVRCTLDRERQIYLFQTHNSSMERRKFIFYDCFMLVMVRDGVPAVGYINLENVRETMEYSRLWKIRGMNQNGLSDIPRSEFLEILKEALLVYGINGRVGRVYNNIAFKF